VFRILSPAAAPRGQPKQCGYRGQRIDISYDLPAVCQFILSWRDKMDTRFPHQPVGRAPREGLRSKALWGKGGMTERYEKSPAGRLGFRLSKKAKKQKKRPGKKRAAAKPCIFAQQSASRAANAAKRGGEPLFHLK